MTDVPSVLLLSVALLVHYRGVQQERVWLVIAGAACWGWVSIFGRRWAFMRHGWLWRRLSAVGNFGGDRFVVVATSCLIFFFCATAWFAFLVYY